MKESCSTEKWFIQNVFFVPHSLYQTVIQIRKKNVYSLIPFAPTTGSHTDSPSKIRIEKGNKMKWNSLLLFITRLDPPPLATENKNSHMKDKRVQQTHWKSKYNNNFDCKRMKEMRRRRGPSYQFTKNKSLPIKANSDITDTKYEKMTQKDSKLLLEKNGFVFDINLYALMVFYIF